MTHSTDELALDALEMNDATDEVEEGFLDEEDICPDELAADAAMSEWVQAQIRKFQEAEELIDDAALFGKPSGPTLH